MPHIHDRIDFTVEVFIVFNKKVLLRTHDKYKIWLGVGGHVELDEDPNQAAIREVKEEVGLDITLVSHRRPTIGRLDEYSQLIPPEYMYRHRISPHHEHVTFTYVATATTDRIVEISEGEKSSKIKWFTQEEVEHQKDLLEDVRYYALAALTTVYALS